MSQSIGSTPIYTKYPTLSVERWFPEHMDTLGYASALERLTQDDQYFHVNGMSGFFPVGYVRPVDGDASPAYTDFSFRSLVRYVTGGTETFDFDNEEQREFYSGIRKDLAKHGLLRDNLLPQELARAYLIVCFEEPTRSIELEKFDNFIDRLSSRTSSQFSINIVENGNRDIEANGLDR